MDRYGAKTKMMDGQIGFIEKINVKSVSLGIALFLMGAGVYMCLSEIAHIGCIDIKSAVLSGKIQTGSLGLLVIFLGTAIVLTVIKKSGIMQERQGEKIELVIGDRRIICENLSFRKVQEIRELMKEATESASNGEKNT